MALKTEQNTPQIEKRIREAFANSSLYTHTCDPFFEHGQWWVGCPACGAQWSVVDAEGGTSVDGFDFEEVTRGEEDAHGN